MKIRYKLPTVHQKYYDNNGKEIPSVTTVLSVLGSKSLNEWSNKIGLEGIPLEIALEVSSLTGTLTHLLNEVFLNGQIDEFDMDKFLRLNNKYTEKMVDEAVYAFESFENFYLKNEKYITTLFTERKMVSNKYGYGGTIDWGFKYKGRLIVGDFKTSNYFNRKMFFQTAAYYYMLLEALEEYDEIAILKLPKNDDSDLEIKMLKKDKIKPYFKYFLKCLEIYEMNHTFKDGLLF